MKSKSSRNMIKNLVEKRSLRYFTLLEIFVCFVIIGMMSGIMLSWGNCLLQHYKFRHSVQGVSNRLALCKQIATCYQTDVVVVITNTGKNSVELSCMTLGKIYPLQGFFYKKKIYHGIKQIFVNGEETRSIPIQFFPTICFPEKIILCSDKDKEVNIDIRNLLIAEK